MTGNTNNGDMLRSNAWRIGAWTFAALLLLLPLVAMQFTDEVAWDEFDFAIAAVLLLGTGIAFELAVRKAGDLAYRAGAGLALVAMFLLAWLSLGVGVIGKDGDPVNLVYFGVIAVGIIGAIVARLQPAGMANTMIAMALVQAAIAVTALIKGLGHPWSGPLEILGLNGFFVAIFVGSALLFLKAARA